MPMPARESRGLNPKRLIQDFTPVIRRTDHRPALGYKKGQSIAVKTSPDEAEIVLRSHLSHEFIVEIDIAAVFDIANLFAVDRDDAVVADFAEAMTRDINLANRIRILSDIAHELRINIDVMTEALNDIHYFFAAFFARAFS
jgi:hypothetical protein